MKQFLLSSLALLLVLACKNNSQTQETSEPELQVEPDEITIEMDSPIDIHPVSHASMVVEWEGATIYVDPVGGASLYNSYPKPDLILVTDIHFDHLNLETLEGIVAPNTDIFAPKAVISELSENLIPYTTEISNGEIKNFKGFSIEAIPMYNLREEALKFHEKGRGNGYVIESKGQRVYVSGDTEDIPEMRGLKHIDKAFVCMNLPYTMTVESAADAVLEFAPIEVYPYHYRGTEGLSDVEKFKTLVSDENPAIKVVQLNWYPETE